MQRTHVQTLGAVGCFTGMYLVIAILAALRLQNWEFVLYIFVVFAFAFVAVALRIKIHLPISMLWALSVWGLLHMAGGLFPVPAGWATDGGKQVLYSLWVFTDLLKYDQLVHAYGFGVATLICWWALKLLLRRSVTSGGVLLFCVLAGMGLGAFNEMIEFFAVLLLPETNVGGYINTGWDLVFNFLGCVIAAVLIRVYAERRSPISISE
ncbi:hypothetical protein A3D11_03350 [Candidatus Peribacteria bacterium RIFCSPHIGHO2_02_FULL_49_16]|nr:MAG: hypothetical protein A2880_04310 [Candidatus Peribacteria bacterium RIFCSPHIGHO2_01_FULL_49_38]OGJ58774.1 MAG: hypothetical protein A3D11_03350 [Candidatus Peribacteria bacterium RIFCSPHIGHO2_02_FULL_49_16]